MNEMTENGKRRYKLKEVCIRLAEGHPLYSDVPLSSPTAALDVMRKELSQYDREILCVVNLNNKLKPINFNIVSMGSINGSVAAIPNILKSGILSNAAGFLLLHNHPSGDVTPSKEDITTTRRCVEAGKLMDIPCLDHVIVGGGNSDYYSFRESGMVDFTSEKISMTAEQILRVNESNSTYKGGTETMPENGRKDDLFVPDFVKEAEEQIAKGVKLPTQEEVTIKFGKGLAEPFQSKDGREFSEEAYRKDVEKTIRNLRSTDRMEFQTLDIENEIADICFSFSRNETEDNCRSIEDLWPRIHEYVIDNWYREKSDGTLEKPSISEIRDLSDWEIDFNAFLDETFEILYNAKHHEQIIHILKDAADLFKWEEDDYLDSYLNDLGMALYGAGRVKEADKMYRERLAEDPGNMTILNSYLWELVYTTKEYERALEVTEEQLPLKKGFDPNLEMVYLRVIDACDAMGNTEEANKYRKMLKEYEREEKEKKQRVKERFDGTLFQEPVVKAPKIGRNDPCPCGSGKKYKKCCGKN